MNIAERVYETVKTLPEQQAAEVLDFAEFLKSKAELETLERSQAFNAQIDAINVFRGKGNHRLCRGGAEDVWLF